jgi:hypothetical protein
VKTATLMRLDCPKHGPTLHQKCVRQADGTVQAVEVAL